MTSRVSARASSLSSAALSETDSSAVGRRFSVVWRWRSQRTSSCWWRPACTDPATTTAS